MGDRARPKSLADGWALLREKEVIYVGWLRCWQTFPENRAIPQSSIEADTALDVCPAKPPVAVQVEEPLRDLEATIPAWRDKAAAALVRIGAPAVPGLLQRLSPQKELSVRQWAASVVGRIGPDAMAAIPDLIQDAVASHAGLREAALEASPPRGKAL
jgi:HEAT repeat protein